MFLILRYFLPFFKDAFLFLSFFLLYPSIMLHFRGQKRNKLQKLKKSIVYQFYSKTDFFLNEGFSYFLGQSIYSFFICETQKLMSKKKKY